MLLVIGVFAQNRVSERQFVLENKAQVTRDCPFSAQIGFSKVRRLLAIAIFWVRLIAYTTRKRVIFAKSAFLRN